MAGKGDKPRPTDKKVYNNNYDQIKWDRNINIKTPIKTKSNKLSFKY
jgi:hypothetical protein